eukprot:TRINITY_DN1630_c0_g1_i5.p2 TRINITY_DN1630_c0_g1~~TRINITY_DN1630_c0_g1_i5.p2  ORF type:complete len:222 (-),score=64.76 TRINITY_DN1630_c0_g1_i5:845-1510(-)
MFKFPKSVSWKRKAEPAVIDKKLQSALKQRTEERKKHGKHPSFDGILLKFPKIDQAFLQIRKVFDKFDEDHSNTIDLEELRHCLRELKVHVSEQEVLELYKESDMDSANGVEFKEFILTMALVYLLKPLEGSDLTSRFGLPEVVAAFEIIVEAFLICDMDGDGFLTKEEVKKVFGVTKESRLNQFARQRFAEMDYNTDGHCSFKEFLYAFVGWVGTAEVDE